MKQLIGVGMVLFVLGLMVGSTSERLISGWWGEQYMKALADQAYGKPILLGPYSESRVSVSTGVLNLLGRATDHPTFLGNGSEMMALGFDQDSDGSWLYHLQPDYYVIKRLADGRFIVVDNNRFCRGTGLEEALFCRGATGPNTIGGLRHIILAPQAPNHN